MLIHEKTDTKKSHATVPLTDAFNLYIYSPVSCCVFPACGKISKKEVFVNNQVKANQLASRACVIGSNHHKHLLRIIHILVWSSPSKPSKRRFYDSTKSLLTLIVLGKVKVDLADFDAKLLTNFSCMGLTKNTYCCRNFAYFLSFIQDNNDHYGAQMTIEQA